MQTKYTVALSVAAGFALGVAAIQALQAQAKPPGYLVAEVAVTVDPDTYMKSPFLTETMESTKDAGAKYLAGGFNNASALSAHQQQIASSFSNSRTSIRPRLGMPAGRKNANESWEARSPRASAFWLSMA